MNGIDKIKKRIEADTQLEIDGLTARTRQECEEIKGRYENQAKKEYWSMVEESAARVERRLSQMDSAAQMEAKKQLLALKQEMVSEAFDLAVKRLAELPEEKYVPFLVSLLVTASVTGDEEVILNQSDRVRRGEKLVQAANTRLRAQNRPGSLTLSEQTRSMGGGGILKRGKIETNCSLEALVGLQKTEMSGRIAKILFD